MFRILRVSIGVTTGATFCGVVGHKRRHEYTVIGRKVNMAARLMMHYHDKVTCDDDTFTLSRLSVSNFDILTTKRMKGLRHVGTIREFKFHENEETGLENTLPYFDYPILDREQHIELFTHQLNKLQHAEVYDTWHQTQDIDKKQHDHRRHVVYVGAAGIGKTRLLDHFTVLAAEQNVRCLSFDLTTSDINKSHFLARHILKVLLVTSGFSQEVDSEPLLLENLRHHKLIGYLHSFSDVIGVKLKSPDNMTLLMIGEKESKDKRYEIYKMLVQSCLDKLGPTVFILDDMRSCDIMSWDYLYALSDCPLALIVLGVRPKSIDEPSCPAAQMFFERGDTVTMDVENIDQRFMTALACQILDVSRLHRDIDSLVRKLSHGIPSWTEQLLLAMYEKKQLLIVINDGKQSLGQSTVSPQTIFITKKPTKERRSSRVDRRKQSLVFDTSLQTSNAEAGTEFAGEMLACLGYIPNKPGALVKSSTNLNVNNKRVAILADGVRIKDLGIPSSMSNMVVERLDSMRSLDQLIIKCSAVIGQPLSREIIKAVLPKANMFKIKMSLKRLFKNGTFQCATISLMMDRTQKKCWCPRNQKELEEPGGVVCNHFGFRNILLQETAYNTLMSTQRTELHLKTTKYLLETIESSRQYLPLYLYSTNLVKLDEQFHVNGNMDERKKNLRVKDVLQDISKSGNMDSYLHHLNSTCEANRQKDLLVMIPVYKRVKYHLEAAGEFRHVVDTLIEAASVAVVLEKSSVALRFLDEAKSAVATLCGKDAEFQDTLAKYTEACIERLRGKAMFLSGRLEEAYRHLRKAGSILGLYQPTAKWQINIQMIKLQFSTFPSSTLLKSFEQYDHISTINRRLVEAGNCLSDLCRLHKEQENHTLLLFDSRRLANLYQHTLPHPQQLLESFIHLIDYCRIRRWTEACHRLELELFATCVSLSRYLSSEDIRLLAKTFCHGASCCVDNGAVVKAINIGDNIFCYWNQSRFETEKIMVSRYICI
ncbi:adenylate cyclase type 10 [Patella vulgata]|uniref:adenylate cyclase type 10 n=1 Tax=Patella vulgata TaxID=6465 RepID=UPI0024A98E92|nr:adenylate cyclase type 10 [Patella vulgata]